MLGVLRLLLLSEEILRITNFGNAKLHKSASKAFRGEDGEPYHPQVSSQRLNQASALSLDTRTRQTVLAKEKQILRSV